jgi:hypothetical protein
LRHQVGFTAWKFQVNFSLRFGRRANKRRRRKQ